MNCSDRREALCLLLHRALVEIRFIADQGGAEQAAQLADAIHNVPLYMDSPTFDLPMLKGSLERYCRAYPRPVGDQFDYLSLVAKY